MLTLFLDFSLVMHVAYSERQETEQGIGGKFFFFCTAFLIHEAQILYTHRDGSQELTAVSGVTALPARKMS